MAITREFLGTGWAFPPRFDRKSLTVDMVSEEEDIAQSLYILLSTRPGERITNPFYGCNLHNMMFESIDPSVMYMMKDAIRIAVLYYEPRINLEEITVNTSRELEGLVEISISYTIRKVNIRSNIVYPFYKLEGTIVTDV